MLFLYYAVKHDDWANSIIAQLSFETDGIKRLNI